MASPIATGAAPQRDVTVVVGGERIQALGRLVKAGLRPIEELERLARAN
jgi:hypothetical protein